MVLISLLIDEHFCGALDLRSPPWSLLAVLFLGLEISCDLAHGLDPPDRQVEALLWARRSLLHVDCVWATHVRSRVEDQQRQLQSSRAALAEQLARSLMTSALAHDVSCQSG
ncbi:hypothetical protein [Vulcanococcus sp.]|jgi:hypothetical protein|uniref:hypothetical protein n=1 Tax=Vulcanococcus sp. TaxID=2856995 RepID=UPI0037D9DBE1